MADSSVVVDPRERTAASWSGRFAALKSRGVEDSDPRAQECVAALSWHRLSKVIDGEVTSGNMSAEFAGVVKDLLAEQAVAL